RSALLSGNVAYARATWSRVQSQLDAYAEQLAGAYVEACEATKVRDEETRKDLALREACLSTRASALRQTVSVLRRADAEVVERAVELVVALPGIDACTDLEALRRAAAPSVAEPEQAQLRGLREQVAEARVWKKAGKIDEGRAIIDEVLPHAEALGDGLLLAEARLVAGTLRADLGDLEGGTERLEQALDGALEHGADALAVEALSTLIYLVGVDRAEPVAALMLGTVAQGLVDRIEPEGIAKAQVLTAIGQAWFARGDLGRAQTRFERALELLQAQVGDDHIELAEPLSSLAVVLRRRGQLDRAHLQYLRALDIRIHWQGELHPQTANQRINLAAVLIERGEPEQAEQQLRMALEVLISAPVRDDKTIAHARNTLGALLMDQRDYAASQQQFRLAAEDWERVHGPLHPNVAAARLNLGFALRRDGKLAEAVEQYERSVKILRSNELTLDRRKQLVKLLEELATRLDALERTAEADTYRAEAALLTSTR
ncbi:MAG: tetratricopeptide repeat protein, partial [Myxococcales bacterium]|nr:tetratricopeptide repeat protein [Myxococcales bacterium]